MIRSAAAILILCLVALTAGCSRKHNTKDALFERGNGYIQQKNYKAAIIEYRLAIQQDPKFGRARLKLGAAYAATAEVGNAYKEYVRAADLLPDDVEAQVEVGTFLVYAHKYDEAKARAERAIKLAPNHANAQILLGDTLAGLKNLDGAVTEIEKAIKLAPNRADTYSSLGAMQYTRGDQKAAEQAYKRAVEIDPKSIAARMAVANYYKATGKTDETEEALKQALRLDPKNLIANRALSDLYRDTNRAQAAEPYLRAIVDATQAAEAKMDLARYYASLKRFTDAEAILKVLVIDTQSFGAAQLLRARIALASNRKADAGALIDEVLARDPNQLEALLGKGRLLLADGRFDEAIARAKAAVKADSRSADAVYLLAQIYMAKGELLLAEKAFTETLKLNPRAEMVRLELSHLQLQMGKTDSSAQMAQETVTAAPESVLARIVFIQALLTRRDIGRAEQEIKALSAKYPNAPTIANLQGSLELLKGNSSAARRAYQRALDLDPGSVEALRGLVDLDVTAKNMGDARVRVDAALAKAPNNAALHILAARVYAKSGDAAQTERLLRKAIDIDPSQLQAYFLLGQLYVAQDRIDEARHGFEALVKRRPDSVGARTMVGVLLQTQNQQEAAKQQYERILETYPQAAVAANNLAWMYAEGAGNLDLALQLAQTAKAALPDQHEVNDTLGWIYYKKGMPTLAITALKQSVSADPQNPIYQYHLGLAYVKNGEKALGQKRLEQALASSGDFEGAADARRALQSLRQ